MNKSEFGESMRTRAPSCMTLIFNITFNQLQQSAMDHLPMAALVHLTWIQGMHLFENFPDCVAPVNHHPTCLAVKLCRVLSVGIKGPTGD